MKHGAKLYCLDDAKEALENLNNTEIEGRTVRLEFSQRSNSGRDGGPTKMFFFLCRVFLRTLQIKPLGSLDAVGARIVRDRETGSSEGLWLCGI